MNKWIKAVLNILMCTMFFTVGYNYCNMKYAIMYYGASAPREVAFLYAVPFLAAMTICIIISFVVGKMKRT